MRAVRFADLRWAMPSGAVGWRVLRCDVRKVRFWRVREQCLSVRIKIKTQEVWLEVMQHEVREKEEEMGECARVAAAVIRYRPQARLWDEQTGLGEKERLVVFVRHGEGQHNVWAAQWRQRAV